jgi:outer membrane protein assembly factor BamB
MERYDPAGTSHAAGLAGPTSDVEVDWRAELPRWFNGQQSPIFLDGTLYLAGNGLVAIDADAGDQQFAFRAPAGSTPARADSAVHSTETLVVTSNAGVAGLNRGGGLRFPIAGAIAGTRWQITSESGSQFFQYEPISPVTVDRTAYVILPETEQLAALNTTDGSVIWEAGRSSIGISRVDFRPAVRNGTIYTANQLGGVAAIDADTGDLQWDVTVDGLDPRPPTATADGVVVPMRQEIYYLAGEDGSVEWHRELDGNAIHGSAAVDGQTVYWANGTGTCYAFDLPTGETQWSTEGIGAGYPVVADGVLYLTHSNQLTALDSETGNELFDYVGTFTLSPSIVADGRLYHVDSGHLVALETAP